MIFESFNYVAFFLPAVLVLYALFRTSPAANLIIMGSSLFFYGWTREPFLILLIFAASWDFILGGLIFRTPGPVRRKMLLVLSVAGNLGVLAYFKYGAWAFPAVNDALSAAGIAVTLHAATAVTPPGLSFYTFQTMSYTIDIYRGHLKPEKNIVNYFAFVSMFPQLIAGPIERARDLLPQLSKARAWTKSEDFHFALFLISWGTFKKVAIADNFGAIVDMVLTDYQFAGAEYRFPGSGLLLMYAFGMQIYCDFSAYSDIARGSALLFGVKLSRNFLTPYFASNPSEFWQRWHITLSSWLRDYLYIPLGGSQGGRLNAIRNLIITMALGGLWHGAGIFFVVWGLWHGALLAIYRVVPIDAILRRRFGAVGNVFAITIFFHLVFIGWIWFRCDLNTAPIAIASIGNWFNHPLAPWFWERMRVVVMFALPILVSDWLAYRRGGEFVDLFREMRLPSRVGLYVTIFYGILFLAKRNGYDFIYFQF